MSVRRFIRPKEANILLKPFNLTVRNIPKTDGKSLVLIRPLADPSGSERISYVSPGVYKIEPVKEEFHV